jgi:hypothetical protein
MAGLRTGAWIALAFGVAVIALIGDPPAGAASPDASAALTPAPGTGHGVLGSATPDDSSSLEYSPGLGAGCPGKPGQIAAYPLRYGPVYRGPGVVGLPVSLCIGAFPAHAMQVRITAPDASVITLRNQVIDANETGVSIQVLVLPAPPGTRYQVVGGGGARSAGRFSGTGAGRYTVRVDGGTTATQQFVLESAPTPRILNLTGMQATVERGGRLRFGVAGQQALSTFQVGIFGPYVTGSSSLALRTTVVGRADRLGQAIVTLDVLPTSVVGYGYVAMLDPATPLPQPDALDPRVAMFDVTTGQPR